MRSPPSPLDNTLPGKKKSNREMLCSLCKQKSSDPSAFISCDDCKNQFHGDCAFISNDQFTIYKTRRLPWMCPTCYYNKTTENADSIKEFRGTLRELESKLGECLDTIKTSDAKLASIRQEFTTRMQGVETSVAVSSRRIDDREFDSNCIVVEGIIGLKTEEAANDFVICILTDFGIPDLSKIYFKTYFNVKDSKLFIYFLNKTIIAATMKKYYEYLESSDSRLDGVLSSILVSLKIPPSPLKFSTISQEPYLQRRMEILEQEKLSKEIKISGIKYLVTETVDSMKATVTNLAAHVGCELSLTDFMVRRVRKSATCFAVFHNIVTRDEFFYKYMKLVTAKKSAGIRPQDIGLSSSSNIFLNDSLTEMARMLHGFAKLLKQQGVIKNFSSRRGGLVVKLLHGGDDWIRVNSIDDLQNTINS